MGRKRVDAMKQDKGTKIWSYPVWNEKLGRMTWKSSGSTDKITAEREWLDYKSKNRWMSERGADMTWRTARQIWAADHDPTASRSGIEGPRSRWDCIEHRIGDVKIAGSEKVIIQLRNDLEMNKPGTRVFKSAPNMARNRALISSTINLYLIDLIRYANHVARKEDKERPGEFYFPKQLVPVINKLERKKSEPHRPSKKLSLSKEQVLALMEFAKAERIAAGETRMSWDEQMLAMLYFGGGQRSHRVAMLRWDNVKWKAGVNGEIDFWNIEGVHQSDNKKGNPQMQMTATMRAVLLKMWGERRAENNGFILDAPGYEHSIEKRRATYIRVRLTRLFLKVLGLTYGGPHVFRKTVATHMANAGHRERVHEVLGISFQTAETHYIQQDANREAEAMSDGLDLTGIGQPVKDRLITLKGRKKGGDDPE